MSFVVEDEKMKQKRKQEEKDQVCSFGFLIFSICKFQANYVQIYRLFPYITQK